MRLLTICDMHYKNNGKAQMNYKGLLGTNPDQTVAHTKPAYFAAQNVFAIFDDALARVTNFTCKASVTNALAAFAYSNKTSGAQVVTLWFKDAAPVESNTTTPVDFVLDGVKFTEPVYADLRTGKVYALPKEGDGIEPTGKFVYQVKRTNTEAEFFRVCQDFVEHDGPATLSRRVCTLRALLPIATILITVVIGIVVLLDKSSAVSGFSRARRRDGLSSLARLRGAGFLARLPGVSRTRHPGYSL